MYRILENLTKEYKSDLIVNIRLIKVSDLTIVGDLKKACEDNYCGNYGLNWMCPPEVGTIEELNTNLIKFNKGYLIQTIHELEDSYDFEGMKEAIEKHTAFFRKTFDIAKKEEKSHDILALNAGACTYCKSCACKDKEKCRFPEKAMSSLEAYGIDVNALLTSCGLKYNNGVNTVSYVGVIFYEVCEIN